MANCADIYLSLILARADAWIELLVVLAFVLFSVVGSIGKAIAEKKQQSEQEKKGPNRPRYKSLDEVRRERELKQAYEQQRRQQAQKQRTFQTGQSESAPQQRPQTVQPAQQRQAQPRQPQTVRTTVQQRQPSRVMRQESADAQVRKQQQKAAQLKKRRLQIQKQAQRIKAEAARQKKQTLQPRKTQGIRESSKIDHRSMGVTKPLPAHFDIARMSHTELRTAIIVSEILGKPVGLREPGENTI